LINLAETKTGNGKGILPLFFDFTKGKREFYSHINPYAEWKWEKTPVIISLAPIKNEKSEYLLHDKFLEPQ